MVNLHCAIKACFFGFGFFYISSADRLLYYLNYVHVYTLLKLLLV